MWCRLASRSLWLDEAVIFWSIKDGFAETIHRVVNYQNQSPMYNLVVWAVKHIFGSGEMALRLISFAATLGSCFIVYSIGRRVFERESALLAVFFFMTLDDVVSAATNVRPYSFGILFAALSMLMLMRWMKSLDTKHLAGYALSLAATIYSHFLFAAVLLVQLFYFGTEASRTPALRRQAPRLVVALLVTAVCLLPALPQLSLLRDRSHILAFAQLPGVVDLLCAWFPPHVLLFVIAGILAARDRRLAGPCVPPSGLHLLRVDY